jgi:hypothetical protein
MKSVNCLICGEEVFTSSDKDLCRICGNTNNNGIAVEHIAKLQQALKDLLCLAYGAVEEKMTTREICNTIIVRINRVIK